MSPEKFDSIIQKITKQFGDWCTKNNVYQWEKQKDFFDNLLVKHKLLKHEDSQEFWRAVGATCDFMDDAEKKISVKDWKWQSEVASCVLYMNYCIRRPRAKSEKHDEYA